MPRNRPRGSFGYAKRWGQMQLVRLPPGYLCSRQEWLDRIEHGDPNWFRLLTGEFHGQTPDHVADTRRLARAEQVPAQLYRQVTTADGVPWPCRDLRALPGGILRPW